MRPGGMRHVISPVCLRYGVTVTHRRIYQREVVSYRGDYYAVSTLLHILAMQVCVRVCCACLCVFVRVYVHA
jgi:hypothetical protein